MNKQSPIGSPRLPSAVLTGSPLVGTEGSIAKPWGNQPICPGCNRGSITSCLCDIPDPEPEYFRPGGNYDPEGGWAFAERCAIGMAK